MKSYSPELLEMVQTKLGYRSEDYSGSGICDAEEVISFEMNELENRDIPKFCETEYGIMFEEDRTTEWLGVLLSFLRDKLNTDTVFLLWLTRKEDIGFYCYDEGLHEIGVYSLPENAIPISDLGREGALFALDIHPDFMDPQTEVICIPKQSKGEPDANQTVNTISGHR